MSLTELSKMYFSQAAISAWLSCPRKFRFRYIEGLYWPLPPEALSKLEPGRKFHLLAQQYYQFGYCHLPVGEGDLAPMVRELKNFLPAAGSDLFLPEYELRCRQGELRLLAKYDLLVESPGGIVIYDWKTDQQPPRANLLHAPQTRLYLYLLCSVPSYFDVAPHQVQMQYWNPRFPDEPRSTTYSQEQYLEDGRWLTETIQTIQGAKEFPGIEGEACRRCEYRPVCHGRGLEIPEEDGLNLEILDWDALPELAWGGNG